jgi:hypothetical protein
MKTENLQLILSKLDELMAKIGGAATDFYPMVVQKTMMSGALFGTFWAVLGVAVLFVIRPVWKSDESKADKAGLTFIISVISSLFFISSILCWLQYMNAEYYAVRDIIKMVKPD